MAIYTVLAPPVRDGDTLGPDPTGLVFIKEGFSWPALLIAELWLLYRRMWLVFLAYIVVAGVVLFIDSKIGGLLPSVFLTLTHLLFALEGNQLRRWTLMRRGYRFIGVVGGHGQSEAEIRYFTALEESGAMPPPAPPAPPTPPMRALGPLQPSAEAGDVVGLFPAPGGKA